MAVAVIGGGYAGMAAAVALAEAGIPVTLYEAGRELGGRARRVPVNGVTLDNGLHVLIGAYRETLRLVRAVHPNPEDALMRLPLDWNVYQRFRLKAAPLPAPFHLGIALLGTRGATWRERYAAARFMHAMRARKFVLDRDITVKALLNEYGQDGTFARFFWEPLCVAALNTPPAIASAQVFLNVLRDGVNANRTAGDILLARSDLSALFPDPAGNYVRSRGGRINMGVTVRGLTRAARGIAVRTQSGSEHYEHVVCAVSPHQASALLTDLPELASTAIALDAIQFQPIYTVYLQLTDAFELPAPMLGLTGTAHWLFDRNAICGQRGLIAAVISGKGPHQELTQDELARTVYSEIATLFAKLPPLAWHRVIAEKRATFECAVGVRRPSTQTSLPDVHLAGDYTESDYPATLESAVRSGLAAAAQVIGQSRLARGAMRPVAMTPA